MIILYHKWMHINSESRLYEFSDNSSELSCSGQINFLSRFCPIVITLDIIAFICGEWTLWTNWTLFLLELEKKIF